MIEIMLRYPNGGHNSVDIGGCHANDSEWGNTRGVFEAETMYETTKKRIETERFVTEMWFESTLEHQELRYVKNSALGDRTPLYLSGSVCQNKA